jgi:plasmid stabilization system protein ParE
MLEREDIIMSTIETLSIELPTEIAALLEQAVSSGEDASRTDVILEALQNWLSRQPQLGRPRPELYPGLRSFPIGHFVAFYRPVAVAGIEIVRVLHSARDQSLIQFGPP